MRHAVLGMSFPSSIYTGRYLYAMSNNDGPISNIVAYLNLSDEVFGTIVPISTGHLPTTDAQGKPRLLLPFLPRYIGFFVF